MFVRVAPGILPATSESTMTETRPRLRPLYWATSALLCLLVGPACNGGAPNDDADAGASDGEVASDTTPDAPPPDGSEDVADTLDGGPTDATDAGDAADTVGDASDGGGDTLSGISPIPNPPEDTSVDRDALPTTFGPAAVIDSLELADDCCRDLDGDGSDDNAIAALLSTFAAFADFDVNTRIAEEIDAAELIYLFEFGNWSNLAEDDSIEMYSHPGRDATPDDLSDNFTGTGPYRVDPASYRSDGTPLANFTPARVEPSNKLRASADELPFTVPFLEGFAIEFTLRDVEVRATTSDPAELESGGHVTLEEGRLSGALPQEALIDNLNRIARSYCPCLGGERLFREARPDEFVCNDPPDACAGAPGLAQMCDPNVCEPLLMPQLRDNADLNINPSPRKDAYSIGLQFSAVGAHIEGVASSD